MCEVLLACLLCGQTGRKSNAYNATIVVCYGMAVGPATYARRKLLAIMRLCCLRIALGHILVADLVTFAHFPSHSQALKTLVLKLASLQVLYCRQNPAFILLLRVFQDWYIKGKDLYLSTAPLKMISGLLRTLNGFLWSEIKKSKLLRWSGAEPCRISYTTRACPANNVWNIRLYPLPVALLFFVRRADCHMGVW